jgi:predicted nucleic acid-binding protein
MRVYVDSSVLLRIVLKERNRLRAWSRIQAAACSELTRVECFRTLDRARLSGHIADDEVAQRRLAIDEMLESFDTIALDRRILRTAAEPLPTTLGTLDAIHLASARALRTRYPELTFASHDKALVIAARAVGFRVLT